MSEVEELRAEVAALDRALFDFASKHAASLSEADRIGREGRDPSFGEDWFALCGRVHELLGGCCGACRGTGFSSEGVCWDCRGTGHPHPMSGEASVEAAEVERLWSKVHAEQAQVARRHQQALAAEAKVAAVVAWCAENARDDHPHCWRINCSDCARRDLVQQVSALASVGRTEPAPEAGAADTQDEGAGEALCPTCGMRRESRHPVRHKEGYGFCPESFHFGTPTAGSKVEAAPESGEGR
jgi:hypothetical protein